MGNSWLDKTQGQNIGGGQQALGPHNFTKSAPMVFNVFALSETDRKRVEKRAANVPADLNRQWLAHSVPLVNF